MKCENFKRPGVGALRRYAARHATGCGTRVHDTVGRGVGGGRRFSGGRPSLGSLFRGRRTPGTGVLLRQ